MPAPHWPQRVLLHDHIDASFPLLSILPQLHRMSNKPFPFDERSGLHKQIEDWFFSDRDIVERFSVTTGVMQKPETISLVAETYTKVRARQGFKYCEFTVAPQYHVPLHGFKNFEELFERNPQKAKEGIENVVSALILGIKQGEGEYPQIEVNLLFTVGREVRAETGVFLVETAARCDRNYVVGIGLVCDEANNPPEKHISMFKRAKELGFKTTCHAGEWVSASPDFEKDLPALNKNVRIAIFGLGVDRVGHAIGLAHDASLMETIIEKKIGIEGCPGSNFASKLIPNTRCLKIRELLQCGVRYSLNPDDDLFLPTLNETFALCDNEYDFSQAERRLLQLNAWITRFGHRKQHDLDFFLKMLC